MNRCLLLAVTLLIPPICVGEDPLGWEDLRLPSVDRTASDEIIINQSILSLSGRAVEVRGYIIPSSVLQSEHSSGLKHFGMVAEIKSETAVATSWKTLPLHLVVAVEADGSSTAKFVTRPIEVGGELKINVRRNGQGAISLVYTIVARRIEAVEPRERFRRALKGDGC